MLDLSWVATPIVMKVFDYSSHK